MLKRASRAEQPTLIIRARILSISMWKLFNSSRNQTEHKMLRVIVQLAIGLKDLARCLDSKHMARIASLLVWGGSEGVDAA